MSAAFRAPAPAGSLVDRTHAFEVTFAGRRYPALAGDTLASALAASGEHLLSRSFKHHRARGIFSMAGCDASSLVQVGDEPNVHADRLRAVPDLVASPQNVRGSLAHDAAALAERLDRFLPPGFYYKAFHKPRGAWALWEPVIRRIAGLGKVNVRAAGRHYGKRHLHADVAVVGAGAAGLAAALAAARAGADVALVDQEASLGGALRFVRFDAEGGAGAALCAELVAAVRAEPRIAVLADTRCTGLFADGLLALVTDAELVKLRARAVVVATGSIEQPIVFRNNDLPGVMLGGAAQRLLRLYGVRPGTRAVVAVANDAGYGIALDLEETGVPVSAVVDLRAEPAAGPLAEAARERGIALFPGHAPCEALPARGRRRIAGVRIARILGDGRCDASAATLPCDVLAMAAGVAPDAALLCHTGARLAYDEDLATLVAPAPSDPVFVAGAVDGLHDLDAVAASGRRAGVLAARRAGFETGGEAPRVGARAAVSTSHPWPIFPHPKGKEFVDTDEDLTVGEIRDSVAEGYDQIELLKRFSTLGMGASQGRHSSVTALRLLARATGRKPSAVGTTTVRPPVFPEKLGVVAGPHLAPVRRTAMHARHASLGAVFMPADAWLRPAYYRRGAGEPSVWIADEVRTVREAVGLIDVSTLGGVEVRGPDAAVFLDRFYAVPLARVAVGAMRYALACDATGVLYDDGVACRIGDDRFYVTTTTGAAERVVRDMLFWNAQWRLDVDVANVTAGWGAVNVAGRLARSVLERVCRDVDLDAEAFPRQAVRIGRVAGIPARLLRVAFVGELGYEIHAPRRACAALWDALLSAGRAEGIRPFGVEAQRVLRLEKGHLIVGQDTDGLTHPLETPLAGLVGLRKPFFVGQRALAIHAARGVERRLVGFAIDDPAAPLPKESHLVVRGGEIAGRVTSVVRSPSLGRAIGLAWVAPDQADRGARIAIQIERGRTIEAVVARTPFYDPENRRLAS
jgi:sarcosine oxidase subunit alpha